MERTFDYVVNFWFGPRGSRKTYRYDEKRKEAKETNTNYGAWYHKVHHYFLLHAHCKFLKKHKIKNLKNIIFVVNLTNEDRYNNILNEVNEVIEWHGLQDRITVITHDNTNHSYGAWNAGLKYLVEKSFEGSFSKSSTALKARPTSTYAFLCEDDYIPTDENFYQPFFDKFKEGVNNKGYVASHVDKMPIIFDIKGKYKRNNGDPYDVAYPKKGSEARHAAVSNGFISMQACKEIYLSKGPNGRRKTILKLHKPNIYDRLSNRAWEQIQFTGYIEDLGYKLEGISGSDYYVPFDTNNSNKAISFGMEGKYTPIKPYKYPDKVNLRPLIKQDLNWFLAIRNDETTRHFLKDDNQFTLKEAQEWWYNLPKKPFDPYLVIYNTKRTPIEHNLRQYDYRKTVSFVESEEKVGYIRQYETDIDNKKYLEIGADVHPSHRKKGYAKAAYVKKLKDLETASLWVFEDNFARNLYYELGFRDNGKTKINRGRKEYQMIWRKKN